MAKSKNEIIQSLHENNILVDKREIWITNTNSDEDDINPTVASQFVKNLSLLESINQNPIIIHMCAGFGGYVESGYIIYDAIKSSKCRITMLVHGLAASMSSIILQAADVRILSSSAYLMIHYGYISVPGQTFVSTKSLMEKLNDDSKRDLRIYVDRCKNAPHFQEWKDEKIEKFIKDKLNSKEDWYISGVEAIKWGLACGILGEKGYESIDLFR